VGVILYHALSGTFPYRADNFYTLVASLVRDQPRPLARSCPGLPAALEALVERAIARDPAARYGSARELRAALRGLDRSMLETVCCRAEAGGTSSTADQSLGALAMEALDGPTGSASPELESPAPAPLPPTLRIPSDAADAGAAVGSPDPVNAPAASGSRTVRRSRWPVAAVALGLAGGAVMLAAVLSGQRGPAAGGAEAAGRLAAVPAALPPASSPVPPAEPAVLPAAAAPGVSGRDGSATHLTASVPAGEPVAGVPGAAAPVDAAADDHAAAGPRPSTAAPAAAPPAARPARRARAPLRRGARPEERPMRIRDGIE
jgi:hypothetical protein